MSNSEKKDAFFDLFSLLYKGFSGISTQEAGKEIAKQLRLLKTPELDPIINKFESLDNDIDSFGDAVDSLYENILEDKNK